MKNFIENLKREAESNPILALGAGAAAITAAAKLVDSVGSVRSKNAYAKKMNKKSKK